MEQIGTRARRHVTPGQALLGLAVAIVVSVGASTAVAGLSTFTDSEPGDPFHDEIEAIAAAGITTGFPDGTFRPGDPVSRQAMARWAVLAVL